ncbi:DUF664 domain-containing protein [Kibdelosporangium lantanae]|uniref:DUF664 domain-containing protein n=1 Tax=Kibdelosporangium lantanae TaxID=1497396 RepID=A0ABW3M8Q9_9PSEU
MSNERTELLAELALARAALVRTTKGLSDEQAGERPTVSELCLGGLVKHVGSIEEGWVRFIVEGTAGMSYPLPEGVTWEDLFMGTAREYPQWAIDSRNNFRMRPGETLAEVLELVGDFELVPPGLVTTSRWRPDEMDDIPDDPQDDALYAGVARKQ